MATHPVKRTDRKPAFFWQGVLILLPVLVLAAVGIAATQQDRKLAMRDAEVRAQELAEELARRVRTQLDQPFGTATPERSRANRIVLDATGNLLFPPPFDPVPVPQPLDLSALDEKQREAWRSATEAELRGETNAAQWYTQFIAFNPPQRFAAIALYRRAMLLPADNNSARGETLASLTNQLGEAMSESGLSLQLLARSRLGEPAEFLDYALAHASPITPLLIQQLTNRWPRENWPTITNTLLQLAEQERTRPIAERAREIVQRSTSPPRALWIEGTRASEIRPSSGTASAATAISTVQPIRIEWAESFLLWRTNEMAPFEYRLLPEPEANQVFQQILADARRPEWLGFTLNIAGRDLVGTNSLREVQRVSGGKGGGQYWVTNFTGRPIPQLATALLRENGLPVATVTAWLVGRDLLLAQHEQRTILFSLLIGSAALVSFFGFFTSYRAFHRQLRLSELKSNFVSSVSHELRAPIASVRLMAEGLERGKVSEPAKQREYFRFISQECRRLSAMIENVLDFARIDQGRKQYEFELTDVRALVEQTVNLMQPYAAERGVSLSLVADEVTSLKLVDDVRTPDDEFDQSLVTPTPTAAAVAMIDGPAIQQALVNLIDNAIKHSPSGREVVVKLGSPLTSHPSHLTLSVSDSGPGIPPHEHEKIFERFYRLGSELRRETPGVGIGLSIVKHVVEAHGGCVRVESAPGQGSKFTIRIPLTAEAPRRREPL